MMRQMLNDRRMFRRNLAQYPFRLPAAGIGIVPQWFGGSGTAGEARNVVDATDGPDPTPTAYVRKTWTDLGTAQTANAIGFQFSVNQIDNIPVTPGVPYSVSYYWRASWEFSPLQSNITWRWIDATGQTMFDQNSPSIPSVSVLEWQRVGGTMTPPEGAVAVFAAHRLYAGAALPAVGDTLDGSALLVERSERVNDYMDGDTTGCAWLGVAGASPSAGYPSLSLSLS